MPWFHDENGSAHWIDEGEFGTAPEPISSSGNTGICRTGIQGTTGPRSVPEEQAEPIYFDWDFDSQSYSEINIPPGGIYTFVDVETGQPIGECGWSKPKTLVDINKNKRLKPCGLVEFCKKHYYKMTEGSNVVVDSEKKG